jgi:hypothetical protein
MRSACALLLCLLLADIWSAAASPAVKHPVAAGTRGPHPGKIGGPAKPHGSIGGPAPKKDVLF